MDSQRPGVDVLRTVVRRHEFLSQLEDGPRSKRELAGALERSRSTVDRAVRELEGLDAIRRGERGYRLTATGRLLLAQYRRTVDAFEAIGEAGPLLADLPADAPLSTALLDGADVAEPPRHAPAEPLADVANLMTSAERVRAVMAADRSRQLHSQLYGPALEGDLDCELIVTEPLAGFIRDAFADDGPGLPEGTDLYTLESIPYELVLVEGPAGPQVFVFVIDDATTIRATIRNDTEAALEWGTETYRRFRADATKLPSLG